MIKLGDDYKIEADKYQYVLHKRHATENKKAKSDHVWTQTFHSNIKQCCNAIADNELRKSVQSGIVEEFTKAVDRLCLAVNAYELNKVE